MSRVNGELKKNPTKATHPSNLIGEFITEQTLEVSTSQQKQKDHYKRSNDVMDIFYITHKFVLLIIISSIQDIHRR